MDFCYTELMIVDGKAIARDILLKLTEEIKALPYVPRLAIFTCVPNFETKKYLALKQKRAAEVGIALQLIEFDSEVTAPEIIMSIQQAHKAADGIIVQLPFPARINMDAILPVIRPTHDVDMLTYDGVLTGPLPPVVGAIDEIARLNNLDFKNKSVVVVGRGQLVGLPSILYARARGALVQIVDKNTLDADKLIKSADILILGAGVPGLVTLDMVKPGVIVFDAGTSEAGGVLVGDAAPEVAETASLITPVPGGVGPITIAILLKNVVTLARASR